MVNWNIAGDALHADAWDNLLRSFADAQIFQSHGWGEFKRRAGWRPLRLLASDTGTPSTVIAMAQVLVRALPGGFRFAWVPGGPCLAGDADPQDMRAQLQGLLHQLRNTIGAHYLRCNFTFPAAQSRADAVAACLQRPAVRIGSGRSILLDIAGNDDAWLKTLTSKHRYYVRKACGAALDWRYGNGEAEIAAMAQLSAQLARDKATTVGIFSREDLDCLGALLRDHCRILVGYEHEKPVSACTVFRVGALAYYASAATVGRGRELSAAYAMLFELRRRLREEGVTLLDFGGIAPENSAARGVVHFKLGFNGKVVEYLGEWEAASSLPHRWLGNLAVALRKQGMS